MISGCLRWTSLVLTWITILEYLCLANTFEFALISETLPPNIIKLSTQTDWWKLNESGQKMGSTLVETSWGCVDSWGWEHWTVQIRFTAQSGAQLIREACEGKRNLVMLWLNFKIHATQAGGSCIKLTPCPQEDQGLHPGLLQQLQAESHSWVSNIRLALTRALIQGTQSHLSSLLLPWI